MIYYIRQSAICTLICAGLFTVSGLVSNVYAADDEPVTDQRAKGASGHPLPRFVSLRASEVNMRRGPGRHYPVIWQYRHAGLPVQIIDEYKDWRLVRDPEGDEGWILRALLTSRRSAIVKPATETVMLYNRPEQEGRVLAYLQTGAVVKLRECRPQWCEINAQGFSGWVESTQLWGTDGHDIGKRFD